MADDLHDVVKLLLKRMESHPEEFASGSTRWGWMVESVLENCSKEEYDAINAGLRPIRLQQIHEAVLDELCNGDERRRREQEEIEYEKGLILQHQKSMAQQLAQQQAMQLTQQGYSIPGRVPSRHPTSSDMEGNGIMNALRNIIK